ncbi:flagella basal body P-ring formation protein FlgA [Candidatus Omnitrophota bacterium]
MQANESGAKGDIIRLFNPSTERRVKGLVVGESLVELLV